MTTGYLAVAHDLGTQLAGTAIWHEDRCNWTGVRLVGNDRIGVRELVAALDGDLYGGSSGIALFLAELYAVTGDEVFRRTAMGAIGHALGRASAESAAGAGLYDGRLGIAMAAARMGSVLGEAQLLEQAAAVAKCPPASTEGGFDLISGRAGSAVALLVLSKVLEDQSLLEYAVRLADELLDTAVKDASCYTWSRIDSVSKRPLTGLAHGAAGIGYALGEMFDVTGKHRFARAAEFAFGYEREHFDPEAQNWPDFRHERGRRRRLGPRAFANQWCHGAPGITLSRLRAYRLRNDETCRTEAVAGIATTADWVSTNLTRQSANYSLCHGLAGNAEALLGAEEALGHEWAKERALALRAADEGIERFGAPNRPWPCGTRQGVTPGLMVGLAGIGHFYLRLHDPAVPSVLLLRPESFAPTSAAAAATT